MEPAGTKRNSHYPSIRLYDEMNRLRRRDGHPELDPCEFARHIHTHFEVSHVPLVAEAVRNIEETHGVEFETPKRRSRLSALFARFMSAPEPPMASDE
ncbi:MAG: hypothetical protein AB1529_01695 [Candidatus Micrarchaeota archaeon]